MKKNILQIIIYVSIALSVAALIGYFEFIPNHRYGYSDWDLFLLLELLPKIYFIHGILSGIFLVSGLPTKVYIASTVLLPFLSVFICSSIVNDGLSIELLTISILRSILYFIVSLIGVLIILGIRAMMRLSKKEIGKFR